MQEKQGHPPKSSGEDKAAESDPAMQGRKPGRAGAAKAAPKEAPEHGETGRREFGRDG